MSEEIIKYYINGKEVSKDEWIKNFPKFYNITVSAPKLPTEIDRRTIIHIEGWI